MKLTLPRGKWKWILLALALLLLIVGLYTWWSVRSWQTYDAAWHDTHTIMRRDFAEATKNSPKTDSEYTKKREALGRVVAALKQHDTVCDTHWSIGWQQVLHAAMPTVESCKEMQNTLSQLGNSLGVVVTYLQDEHELQEQLVSLRPSNAKMLDEKQWSTFANAASKVQSSVNAMQPGEDFAPVAKTASKQLKTLTGAWKTFNEAHKKHDKAAWEKARTDLTNAYVRLSTVADASEAELGPLLQRLDEINL